MRRLVMAFLAASLALTACSSSARHASAPPPTSTPAADPYAIPAVITPAYVNSVLAALNHVNGDAVRSLLAAGKVTDTVRLDLRAVYNDPLYQHELSIADETLHGDLANIRRPPGDRSTTALNVISASQTCIFAKTESDFAKVVRDQSPRAGSEYFELTRTQPGTDPTRLNPTPWSMTFNTSYVAPKSVPNQCRA
jgi:hypothetical protein